MEPQKGGALGNKLYQFLMKKSFAKKNHIAVFGTKKKNDQRIHCTMYHCIGKINKNER